MNALSGSSRSSRATWTVSHHRVLGQSINTMDPCIAPTCEDVKTVVSCLDCAEDIRDDGGLSVQEAEPHGPEPTL